MTIENGTAIVLAYVLVSMGVIIAFLLAAFVIGWLTSRLRARVGGLRGMLSEHSFVVPNQITGERRRPP